MKWLVLDRLMVKRAGFGPRMESTATICPVPVDAPDRDAAEALIPRNSKLHRFSVIAAVAWHEMTAAEHANILEDHYVPRPSPRDHYRNAYREDP